MFDKLEDLLIRFEEIMGELNEPDVTANQERFRALMKEQSDLTPIVEAYREYKKCNQDIEDSLMMLDEENDPDMREMLKEELNSAKTRVSELEEELKILLLPKDPNDEKNVIVEIRAGAGGDEAALFAAEIYRMYVRYAERQRWRVETMDVEEIGIGGMKYVSFMISGQGAYSRLKYESGVHRVQRVPETESGGRIHTSTITVAIMPEVEDFDVQIDMNDCKFDVFRASGNGGQCVNTTDSAVRLTHIPTGIVISCQDEKSQLKNKDKALKVLRAKLYDLEQQKRHDEEAELRRSQVGTGDRSEKIRTYNFPQGRVTDHRIKLTLYKIDAIMDGDIQELIDPRRIWRVVENLFSNVCKYALEGTRVYLEIRRVRQDDREIAVFTMKNISAQALNIRADELTERFIRGDISRSTEGSGLGLSIAQNLTTLQKGTFEIYLDGDLFKVQIGFSCLDVPQPEIEIQMR